MSFRSLVVIPSLLWAAANRSGGERKSAVAGRRPPMYRLLIVAGGGIALVALAIWMIRGRTEVSVKQAAGAMSTPGTESSVVQPDPRFGARVGTLVGLACSPRATGAIGVTAGLAVLGAPAGPPSPISGIEQWEN